MNEFEKLVKEMRNTQKEYFRNKQYHTLVASKRLEKLVDNHLSNQVKLKL